jgi:hypothetical protein
MREVARTTGGNAPAELLRAAGSDACVRVVFTADAPIHAKLVDGAGHLLGESGATATDGVVAEGGPVCVRKGDSVVAVPEGGATRVRWMAWQAP